MATRTCWSDLPKRHPKDPKASESLVFRISRQARDVLLRGSDAMLSSLERGHWQAALLMRTSVEGLRGRSG